MIVSGYTRLEALTVVRSSDNVREKRLCKTWADLLRETNLPVSLMPIASASNLAEDAVWRKGTHVVSQAVVPCHVGSFVFFKFTTSHQTDEREKAPQSVLFPLNRTYRKSD